MPNPNTFNLEKTIATWRRQYQHRTVFSTDDLDELEQHLRDQVEELKAGGLSAEAAFNQAVREMGALDNAEAEYGKVFWSKAKREHRLGDEIASHIAIYRNYMLVTLRSMARQKIYAAINILGLAVGLACFILIFLFIQFEFSYDTFYEDADEIHRVTKRNPGDVYLGTDHFALTQAPLATSLKLEFQEIRSSTSFGYKESLISTTENTFWANGLEADASFFNVFKSELVAGDTATALVAPNTMVLTQSLAHTIFNRNDVLGETLLLDQNIQYEITGVIADPPENSTIQYQFLTSIITDSYYQAQLAENRWNSNYLYTFFRVDKNARIADLEARMPGFVNKYLYPEQPDRAASEKEAFFIQPFKDVHLNSTANFDIGRHGSRTQVYLFMCIAVVIMLLASINYVNLAIARAMKRAPEVGVRKTVGAERTQLFKQFLFESLLITLAGLILALGIVYFCLPFFAEVVMREISFSGIGTTFFLSVLSLIILFTVSISGIYPALLMASIHPVDAVKKQIKKLNTRFRFQNVLITVQFISSIVLVTCGYIIYQQLDYLRNTELGFERAHIVNVRIHDNDRALKNDIAAIQSSLLATSGVADVAASHALPTNITMQQTITDWEGAAVEDRLSIHVNAVDYHFLSLFNMRMSAGRPFSQTNSSDAQTACIINETTARALGWSPEQAIGQTLLHDRTQRTVVGVVEDFHLHSMHHAIKPLLLFIDDGGRFDYLSIKVLPASLPQSLEAIEEVIQTSSPFPMEFTFLDDQFDQLYAQEAGLGTTLSFFTIIAFLIAALGLFGLAAFTTEQRTKEIGVRKVLGASSSGIAWMISREFGQLVIIAACIASPIAYIITSHWLQSFAYHVEVTPRVFLFTTVIALLIALMSVGYQAFRAAFSNPINSLRT